jgi:hypothetical protein
MLTRFTVKEVIMRNLEFLLKSPDAKWKRVVDQITYVFFSWDYFKTQSSKSAYMNMRIFYLQAKIDLLNTIFKKRLEGGFEASAREEEALELLEEAKTRALEQFQPNSMGKKFPNQNASSPSVLREGKIFPAN